MDGGFQVDKLVEDLGRVFHPGSVAVIGASAVLAKWGQMILSNILAGGFQGKVFPVNARGGAFCNLPAFRNIKDVPEEVDVAIITTPAETVEQVLHDCAEKGVRGLVVVTSGFSETGAEGRNLEQRMVSFCVEQGMVLIGPNTMGILCPHAGLFATGAHSRPGSGSVAFISQSGNLGTQLIHWAARQGIGISLFVGSGNEAMIKTCHYLEYLRRDPHTRTVILYMENVGDGRNFLDVAAEVNRYKPVIVLKGGRTEAGCAASASHTGAMAGQADLFSSACRQAGLLQVGVPSELLDLSAGFSSLPLCRGNRVGIVTLGGGWGVVTADGCNEKGLEVPRIPEEIVERIGRYLPPFWSRGNPVDLVGTRDPEVPLVAVEELLKWEGVDAVISLGIAGRHELAQALFRSTAKVEPAIAPAFLNEMDSLSREYERAYVRKLAQLMDVYHKPVLGVTLARTDEGMVRTAEGSRYNPVFYQTPETAVNVLARMAEYYRFRELM